MPTTADCLPGTLVSVPGKGFFYLADATDARVNADLLSAAARQDTPGGVTLFVHRDRALDESLIRYLNQLDPRARATTTITVLDPETLGPVTDVPALRHLADRLHLPVLAPGPVDGRDVLPVGPDGQVTAGPAAAHLILPPAVAVQRIALADAVSLADPPPTIAAGLAQMATWERRNAATRAELGLPATPADVIPTGPGAQAVTYAVGQLKARFGNLGSVDVFGLLTSTTPGTVEQLVAGLGGTLAPVRPAALAHQLRTHPGSLAMVTGTAPGSADQQVLWLSSAESGNLTWHDPRTTGTPAFNIDGAQDWRTAVLERDDARVFMLDADRHPVALPEPVTEPIRDATTINPPTSARPLGPGAIAIGPWPQETLDRYGLSALELGGRPVITIDVREVRPRVLDPVQHNALKHTLERYWLHNVRPTVLATIRNPQVEALVRTYQGGLIQQVPEGLGGRVWTATGPGGVPQKFSGPVVTPEMLDAADMAPVDRDRPLHDDPLPPVLVTQLSHNSYQEAAEHFVEHGPELRDPSVLSAMDDIADKLPGDARLDAHRLMLDVAARAPYLAGPDPIAPQSRTSFDPEPAWPLDRPVDLRFLLDYLTAADLVPGADGTPPPGRYQTRLLWNGLLLQAMLGRALTPAETTILARGVGESDLERATRPPGAPEIARAHASIFEALSAMLDERQPGVTDDRQALLQLAECLTGADRVAWHFLIKDILLPHLDQGGRLLADPDLVRRITELSAYINFCH
ncbi:hypothetical protein GCM10010172_85580 [Paractinoplanes ferrugineus]|uniref:Uncharacterized protein n=1 Tax=Paractinoplanes ferrugineus TaxID=113564 RepID=A0A919J928_9ACTN|nr:hypothetical protein [Actinoplanes ferrugineus]GIE15298.1 hypothetical protein Afe05nite_71380 [Actinoplanes ferrugineus]